MPSTLLVTIDSLRFSGLNKLSKTLEYTDTAYSNAYATYPSTVGSFPSIIGGVYPTGIGLSETESFVPHFQSQGHKTAGVTTNVLTSEKYGYGRGFDSFDSFDDESLYRYVGRRLPEGTLHQLLSSAWQLTQPIRHAISPVDREFERATTVIDKLQTQVSPSEDYFAWIHLMDTHHPYHAETKSDISRKEAYQVTKSVINNNGGSDEDEQLTRELYTDTLEQIDDDLQQLWEWVADDTRIIVCGDHGEHFGEHGHWGHHEYLDETLLNVPFLTKNIEPIDSNVISLIDVPTILLQEAHNRGELNREYAFALCDDKRAVIDGEEIVTTEDDYDSAPKHLVQQLTQFNPQSTLKQSDALQEDLEALGYT